MEMSEKQTAVVEDHSHDKVFVVTFLAVLAVLVGIAIVIGIIANTIDPDEGTSPVVLQKTTERLAPIGQVYTDASQLPAPAKPAVEVARAPADILQTVCGACHGAGVLNAPKTGDKAAWDARLQAAGGLDALVASAIAGKGAMPARGGDAGLTDQQVRATVELMLK